jgi:Sulfotransferase family
MKTRRFPSRFSGSGHLSASRQRLSGMQYTGARPQFHYDAGARMLSGEDTNHAQQEQPAALREIGLLVILAPPRCFTTLVSAMLGQHPQMYGLPETYLFTAPTIRKWWVAHRGTDRVDGLSRAVAEIIFGAQREATIELARQWLLQRSDQSTASVLRALAHQVSPLILVEKTPQATEQVDHMQRIIRDIPQARFLHLLRHPFGHVRSRVNRRLNYLRKVTPSIDIFEAAQRFGGADPQMLWYRCNSNILTFLSTVPPEQQMRVQGEALLADPDRQLRKITLWLNLRSDSEAIEAMKHPERSPFARFGPRNALMGGDENFFQQPLLRPAQPVVQSLDTPFPWRRDGGGFAPKVRNLARVLGYT